MSIQNSINFISNISTDNDLRRYLNTVKPEIFSETLKELGFDFTEHEFEETINLLHVKCQFEEQANKLFEVVSWYRLITSTNESFPSKITHP